MGRDLLTLPEAEVRAIRGRDISDDLPGPGHQPEPGAQHRAAHDRGPRAAPGHEPLRGGHALHRAARRGRHPQGRRPHQGLPAPVQRRHAPARDDRHRALLQPQAAARRRADDRARRDHPGADPAPAQEALARARGGGHRHHARPRRGRRHVPADPRHVRRAHRRERPGEAALRAPAPPVHGRAAQERAAPQRAAARHAADHRRPAAGPGAPAAGLRVRAALLPRHGRVLGGTCRELVPDRRRPPVSACFHCDQLRRSRRRCRHERRRERRRAHDARRHPGARRGPARPLPHHQRRRLPAQGRRRVRGRRPHLRRAPRRDARPRRRERLRQDHHRPRHPAAHPAHHRPRALRGRRPRPPQGRPPARAAQAHADDLPGPVREPEQPHDGRRHHRRAAAGPQDGQQERSARPRCASCSRPWASTRTR